MSDEMCPNCVTPWKCNGPHEEIEDRWNRNRADMEARYQEHLALGPDRCPCTACRRKLGLA